MRGRRPTLRIFGSSGRLRRHRIAVVEAVEDEGGGDEAPIMDFSEASNSMYTGAVSAFAA